MIFLESIGSRASSSLTGCYTTWNRLIGNENYPSTVTNCYYLQSGESGKQSGTPLSAEQFTSGELAHLLQAGQDKKVWGQRLGDGGDPYPILLVSLTEEEKNASSVYIVTYNDLPAETSEGPLMVYVNGGVYTPVETAPEEKPGYAFVGWSATEGAATAETSFTVSADMTLYAVWSRFYTITQQEAVNGSITVQESALSGDKVTIACTPDNGYTFGTCTVIATDPEFSITLIPSDMPGTFAFIMPACDVTISAIFVEEQPEGGDDGGDGDGGDGDGDGGDGGGDGGDGGGDGGDGDGGDGDGEDPDPVANTEVGHTEPTARVINGNLLLSVPEPTEAVLFNFSGRALRRLRLPVGDTWITDLPAGLYIVCFDGKKVVKLVINR